ncbi:hypothetical protein [Sphingomonas crocodyli]|uniref:hypothetical protein n=1 Tax=Sphingomonas crocodyli TaxID=1979270 RepID=UPI001F0CBEE5|nr:hypothetical protein [Sphingomonas crocodyli]
MLHDDQEGRSAAAELDADVGHLPAEVLRRGGPAIRHFDDRIFCAPSRRNDRLGRIVDSAAKAPDIGVRLVDVRDEIDDDTISGNGHEGEIGTIASASVTAVTKAMISTSTKPPLVATYVDSVHANDHHVSRRKE